MPDYVAAPNHVAVQPFQVDSSDAAVPVPIIEEAAATNSAGGVDGPLLATTEEVGLLVPPASPEKSNETALMSGKLAIGNKGTINERIHYHFDNSNFKPNLLGLK